MNPDMSRKTILWDLGNTLISTNTSSFAQQLGMYDFMVYTLSHKRDTHAIFNKAFDLLDLLGGPQTLPCLATAFGRPLPPLVRSWLTGHLSLDQVDTFFETPLIEQAPKGFFGSKREARLVEKLLKIITSPELFAASCTVIKEGEKLLKECARQYDQDGEQRHTLYILSNWDPYSLPFMLKDKRFEQLFTYFPQENLIFSGNLGLLKPYDTLYDVVIETYNLTPRDCILIDDQPENIEGAKRHGMEGILVTSGNYQKVRRLLALHNVL